jgi:hypothetical protein
MGTIFAEIGIEIIEDLAVGALYFQSMPAVLAKLCIGVVLLMASRTGDHASATFRRAQPVPAGQAQPNEQLLPMIP